MVTQEWQSENICNETLKVARRGFVSSGYVASLARLIPFFFFFWIPFQDGINEDVPDPVSYRICTSQCDYCEICKVC